MQAIEPSTNANGLPWTPQEWLVKANAAGLATVLAVCGIGWFTGIREFFYGSLIAAAGVALLPVAIALVILLLALAALGVPVIIAGICACFGVEAWGWSFQLIPSYFGWLFKRRNPWFWGVFVGLWTGCLTLGLVLYVVVWPGETQTVETLTSLKVEIDTTYAKTHRYPTPTLQHHLTWEALGHTERTGEIVDGFGRPLIYEKEGLWRVAAYRISSTGFDGRPSRDDFTIGGATTLASLIQLIDTRGESRRWTIDMKLDAIRNLRTNNE